MVKQSVMISSEIMSYRRTRSWTRSRSPRLASFKFMKIIRVCVSIPCASDFRTAALHRPRHRIHQLAAKLVPERLQLMQVDDLRHLPPVAQAGREESMLPFVLTMTVEENVWRQAWKPR
jgi:hypothetical protein